MARKVPGTTSGCEIIPPARSRVYTQVVRYFGYYVWLRRNMDPSNLVLYWKDFIKARLDTSVDVTPVVVSDFFSFISSIRVLKPRTMHRMISTLSSFYRFLYTQGAVTANPMTGMERPKIKGQELRYLKHSQVLKLIDSIDDERDRLLIRTIYATGVRVSELCMIDIDDIDFEEHTIRIRGKGDKIRTVFVDEETLVAVNHFTGARIQGPSSRGSRENTSPRGRCSIYSRGTPLSGSRRTRSGTVMRVSSTRDRRTSGLYRRTSGTPLSRQPRSTFIPTSRNANGCMRSTSRSVRREKSPEKRGKVTINRMMLYDIRVIFFSENRLLE